ncbi:MAG TPA: outer membrane beta-barrel protein [Bdellovibrio sp.]|uniref:outer membrane beta-barrel protein n=1 Tax=Bdellovibrio sp. TaxID=28201 RepID=UPI002F028A5E
MISTRSWLAFACACLIAPYTLAAEEQNQSSTNTTSANVAQAAAAQKDSVEATEPAAEPFSFADFTWLNGNNRQKSALLDSKYFTGSFLADTNYVYDFNRPKDHTLVGSTSSGRTNEVQLTQLGVGGDFHYQHARGRIMTQFGMYSSMTPRNDASTARGQWDMNTAYRYISEAYGGYHWDKMNGINLDAGVFMSYVGLFSYYNAENWAYQASYTSANTPWFFNGLRLQIFPTDRLKTELWLINGWQSYGMFNEAPGVGYQVAYRPTGDLSWVFNGYVGSDTLNTPGRTRYHSDNSVQYKYVDAPTKFISKAAFSLTADLGCEEGGGVKCSGGDSATPSQYFLGFMAYNRLWFDHNQFALTLGAGMINNPGRYLVLIPPIQSSTPGASGGSSATNTAVDGNGNPYFSQNPGDDFRAWDASATFDYMPDDMVTFRAEFIHREANVNYFAGPGGVTSPDGLNTTAHPAGWEPDLVKHEDRINLAMLVRF